MDEVVRRARGAAGLAHHPGSASAPSASTEAGTDTRVLVTGAGGKTGRAVTEALTGRGASVRAFVRDPARVADLTRARTTVRALERDPGRLADLAEATAPRDAQRAQPGAPSTGPAGDVEEAVGDQRDVDDLVAALDGVDAVYAIAPNVSPDEVAMGHAIVRACVRVPVDRLVFHSVVHPQLTAMPHHADKARVEELLIGSGLAWTILQPNAYLQNLAGYADQLRDGRYEVPYATDRRLAMVHLDDVAEVAAACLVDDLGVHATFELSGPAEVSPADVAAVAADLLDRPVAAVRLDPDTWADANADLPEVTRERLLAMFRDYDAHGSPGDGTILTALLGRPPRDLRAYLAELLG